MNLIANFHDPRLSLIQSAIKHVVVHGGQAQPGLAGDDPQMQAATQHLATLQAGAVPGAVSLGDAEVCAKLLAEYGWALLTHNTTLEQQILDQYKDSPCDPGWIEAVESYIGYYWIEGKSPEYYDVSSGRTLSYTLPAPQSGTELVIGVLGDWGTGEPVAQAVLELLVAQKPDLILHVGDIYYSGTEDEAQQNFLALIQGARTQSGSQVPVFTIPGNHDYYSGGAGFYNLIGQINEGIAGNGYIQGASFFNLIGKTWQLQAMDTGYYDSDLFQVQYDITQLNESEAEWHVEQIQAGLAAGRKVILFSHHQLFSALLNIGKKSASKPPAQDPNFNPNLLNSFQAVLSQVSAWFWGHEHLLEVYGAYQGLSIGRCIGHSAFPVLTDSNPYTVVYPEVPLNSAVELGTTEEVYNHGYTLLKLDESSGTATAEYYSVPGDATPGAGATSTLIYQETF
jgi:hypothetical protein